MMRIQSLDDNLFFSEKHSFHKKYVTFKYFTSPQVFSTQNHLMLQKAFFRRKLHNQSNMTKIHSSCKTHNKSMKTVFDNPHFQQLIVLKWVQSKPLYKSKTQNLEHKFFQTIIGLGHFCRITHNGFVNHYAKYIQPTTLHVRLLCHHTPKFH